MNARMVLLNSTLFLSLSFTSPLFSQVEGLEMKLQLLADQQTWGVFVRPVKSVFPSEKLATGSGQVTVVAPVGFFYENLVCQAGTWVENARVDSPKEAPGMAYVSFGFEEEKKKILLQAGSETLLFTFIAPGFEGQLSLIDNENDPFNQLPNSLWTNPGNDLQIVDFAAQGGLKTYSYARNYEEEAGIEMELLTTPAASNTPVSYSRFANIKD